MNEEIQRRPRGRPRLFVRDAMLEKALRLFWEHGYEGVSVAQLVSVMGLSPPSLYAAFGSKEGLYGEALDRYLNGPGRYMSEALAAEPTARGAVERILRQAVEFFTDGSHPLGCMVANAELAHAPENRELARSVAGLRSATITATARRLVRAKREGELPPGVNAKALARFYGAVLQGMSVQARDGATAAELSAVAELALGAWPVPANSNGELA